MVGCFHCVFCSFGDESVSDSPEEYFLIFLFNDFDNIDYSETVFGSILGFSFPFGIESVHQFFDLID